jgi:hypothetical protein
MSAADEGELSDPEDHISGLFGDEYGDIDDVVGYDSVDDEVGGGEALSTGSSSLNPTTPLLIDLRSPSPPTLHAPLARFLTAHGTDSEVSRLVQEYPWQVLDHAADPVAVPGDAWPLGRPQLLKPHWTEEELSESKLRDACCDVIASGQLHLRSERKAGKHHLTPLRPSRMSNLLILTFLCPLADALVQLHRPDRVAPTHVTNITPRLNVRVAIPAALLARFTPVKIYPLTASIMPQYVFRDLAVAEDANIVSVGVGTKQLWFLFPPTVLCCHPSLFTSPGRQRLNQENR